MRDCFVGDLLSRNARKFPNKVAVVFNETRLTYKEVDERANAIANSLRSLGMEKGDRVAFLSDNTFEYLEMYFGPAKAGFIFAPINSSLVARELEYVINYLKPKALIAQPKFVPALDALREKLEVSRFIVLGTAASPGWLSYETLVAEGSKEEPEADLDGWDTAQIIFTGGTTGLPRGAMHTHRQLIHNAAASAIDFQQRYQDVEVHMTPMYHTAMAAQTLSSTFMGNTHVILDGFDAVKVLEAIQTEKITCGFVVPTIINALLQVPDLEKYDLSSFRAFFYGGAPMPMKLLERALKVFKCGFIQLFGQTEAGPLIATLPPEDHVLEGTPKQMQRARSAGRPLVNYEVRIVDDQDRELPRGEIGEIVGRSVSMTKGYWDKPEESAELLRGGWLHTSDLGMMDEDGYIYVMERKKDMIISGGKNIYPTEIEEVLYAHPAILEASVIGVPDDYWGEAVKACVVVREGESLTEEELIQFCKERLASYKKPKSVDFYDSLPKSPQGKLLKRALREKYWAHVEKKI